MRDSEKTNKEPDFKPALGPAPGEDRTLFLRPWELKLGDGVGRSLIPPALGSNLGSLRDRAQFEGERSGLYCFLL